MQGITLLLAQAAPAAPAAPQQQSPFGMFLPLILMFGVFYFMMIRPQQKKAKEHTAWLSQLKRGDEVLTNGGIIGKIVALQGDVLTLEVGDKEGRIKLRVVRSAIQGKPPEVKAVEAEKPAAEKS